MRSYKIKNGELTYTGKGEHFVVPSRVKTIAFGGFRDCKTLKSIVIPDSVTLLGAFAFDGCSKLINIDLPPQVEIKGSAFRGCKKMADADGFVIVRGVLYDYVGQEPNVVIPDGMTEISGYAFEKNKVITSVTIPESVTKIGVCAFKLCRKLESITMASPACEIGDDAIFYWNDLHKLNCTDAVWESFWGIAKKKQAAEFIWRYFHDATFPNNCTQINTYVNKKRSTLLEKAVSLADVRVVSVLLTHFKRFPIDVIDRQIDTAKGNVELLAELLVYKDRKYSRDEIEKEEVKRVEKQIGLRSKTVADLRREFRFNTREDGFEIGFYKGGGAELENGGTVEIPAFVGKTPVIEIGTEAFSPKSFHSREMPKDYLQNSLVTVIVPDTVKWIGGQAFSGCKALENVRIPEGARVSIGAFKGCPKIKQIITNGTLVVYNKSFVTVKVSRGVKRIGGHVFSFESSIKSVVLPEGVEEIQDQAFMGCKKLEMIAIPASTRMIGAKAFEWCKNLTIHAPAGSYAEQYAKENNIPFVAE